MRINVLLKRFKVEDNLTRDVYQKSWKFAIEEREKFINYFKDLDEEAFKIIDKTIQLLPFSDYQTYQMIDFENYKNNNLISFGKLVFSFKDPSSKYSYIWESHQIIAKPFSCYTLLLGLFYHYDFFKNKEQVYEILLKLFLELSEMKKAGKTTLSLDFQNESPNAKFKEVKLFFELHFGGLEDYLELEEYLYGSEDE
ncbi:hypothetical protein C3H43_09575 [Campylobacter jejuni]|uniref:hypothetical protein n=1 Tax=Campylobacter jejuni TaxID=197 RepID=UPI000F7FACD1|nr:hypothetical protein [Campylobacter jejuni]RTJ87174.1 hypothetical protein C3H49_07450 [Campylobacter jejuni]RTJ91838.1 hypothetical protein C3H43_09575 [Campylobacter jejuni]